MMHRLVALAVVAVLAATGCRSGADRPAFAPAGDAEEPGRNPPAGGGWVWKAPPPAWTGMPAADDRDIAFSYGQQHLVLLDGAGRERWRAARPGLRDVAPRLGPDRILAATEEGVAAFRRSDGTKLWDTPLGERANTPVVVGGLAVTSTWEGGVVAVDLAGGAVAWRSALPGPAIGPPATDGTAVVATWAGAERRTAGAVAVDGATGRAQWAVPLPGGGVSAPAITAKGSVVVVGGDLAARALAVATGEERWRTPVEGAGSPEVPPVAVGEGSVLVAHRLGGLDLLDATSGRRIWQVTTDGAAVRGGPVVGPGGTFAFPLDDGRMVLAGPGRPFETRQAPGRISGLAAGPGGLLIGATRGAEINTVEATPDW